MHVVRCNHGNISSSLSTFMTSHLPAVAVLVAQSATPHELKFAKPNLSSSKPAGSARNTCSDCLVGLPHPILCHCLLGPKLLLLCSKRTISFSKRAISTRTIKLPKNENYSAYVHHSIPVAFYCCLVYSG